MTARTGVGLMVLKLDKFTGMAPVVVALLALIMHGAPFSQMVTLEQCKSGQKILATGHGTTLKKHIQDATLSSSNGAMMILLAFNVEF